MFSLTFPDLGRLSSALTDYNTRVLSYSEDAHDAIVGTLSALSSSFKGSFVSGLPVLFFDSFLLWQPAERRDMVRRTSRHQDPNSSEPTSDLFPSWSWLGWEGPIHPLSWDGAMDYVKYSPFLEGTLRSVRTTPIVQWYTQPSNTSMLSPNCRELYDYRQKYVYEDTLPPTGWTRHDFVPNDSSRIDGKWPEFDIRPRFIYKHSSDNISEFWYPIPLPESQEDSPVPIVMPFLYCRTGRAWLYGAERISHGRRTISIRNAQGSWMGALTLQSLSNLALEDEAATSGMEGHKFELVEISMGYTTEGRRYLELDEWQHKDRPKSGSSYFFYNVLWVEWREGVAYRKALGRMAKERWEQLEPRIDRPCLGLNDTNSLNRTS